MVTALRMAARAVRSARGEVGEAAEVAAGQDEGFKGPGGPVGDEGDEEVVLDDDADSASRCGIAEGEFGGDVVAEQAGVVLVVVGLLGGELAEGLVGDVFGGPDLAVGMGVGGAHHGAAVLEDLDVVDPGEVAERRRSRRPRRRRRGRCRGRPCGRG